MQRFTSIIGNSQKLDGGAMFGHVPKTMWSQWFTPDQHNRISLACRALLIRDADKTILLETGIGAFFDSSLRERYGVIENSHVLLQSLNAINLSDQDIDFVILSHLHFDHAGGLLSAWQENQEPKLLFPRARYLVSSAAWQRACNPHIRDHASFIPALNQQLAQSGRLTLIDSEHHALLGNNYRFLFTQGHTPGLMHTVVNLPVSPTLIFASDLIPATPWVHLPITMGYDRMPELLIDEKKEILELAMEMDALIFYTHDPLIAASKVIQDSTGRFRIKDEFNHLS